MPYKFSRSFYCAATLVFVFFIFFTIIGWTRHYGFLTSINDMGHYDQAIWGITKKGYLLNTILFNYPINKIGFHFDPILYLFAPLYYVKPTVNWLILAQAMALSISAWPIFRIACLYSSREETGLLWMTAYLINPFLINAATWDFHPLTLAVPFISAACLAIERRRFYTLLFCCLLILLCKEHLGLMVVGFGILWALRCGSIGKASLLILLGSCHFLAVFYIIMPAFSPTGGHVMLDSQLGQLSRYSWLGNSVSDIITTLLKHPQKVIATIIFKLKGILYLSLLLLPFLGLPFLGISFLIPAWGDLMANTLSSNPLPRGVYAYHSVAILPLFCVAAIRGARSLLQHFKFLNYLQLAGVIALIGLINGYVFTTLPLPGSYNFWGPKNLFIAPNNKLDFIEKGIGNLSSVSVQANIGPHFTQREEIYTFPNKIDKANTIILNLSSPTTCLTPHDQGITGTLANHLQLDPLTYLQNISDLLNSEKYGIVIWEDPWLVFKKNHPDSYSRHLIERKIKDLKNDWHLNKSGN